MSRMDVTEKIITTKVSKGLKWADVAAQVGCSKEWVTAGCLGQMTFTAEQAGVVAEIFGLTADEKKWLMVVPYKGSLPTSATNFSTCLFTSVRAQSGQRDLTANAMFCRTVSQGMSAWLWNTTPRSRLGPAISRPSMKQWPEVAVSRPASTLRTVVLPQPLWPMMQTNSPLSMAKDTSANTGLSAW